jgi:hypothetical protein
MAYRVYIQYKYFPLIKDKWFPFIEQRKYLEDAKNDAYRISSDPVIKKMGLKFKIVKEPADPPEMMERKLLEQLGMKEWSRKRGAIESFFYSF